jgi:hypothetical protein
LLFQQGLDAATMGDREPSPATTRGKRDAFSLLLSQSQQHQHPQSQEPKRPRRSAGSGEAGGAAGAGAARSYRTCPVCSASIPSAPAFAEAHVAACLDRQQQREAAAVAAAAGKRREEEEEQAAAAAAAKAAEEDDDEKRPQQQQQQQQQQPAAGKSAFDELRRGSEAQRPHSHVFYLEHCPPAHPGGQGSWRWHWWPRRRAAAAAGAAATAPPPTLPPPAWEATVTLGSARRGGGAGGGGGGNGASNGAVEVRLQTNLPSGDGADVSFDNPLLASNGWPPGAPTAAAAQPHPPRWRGSAAVLKSALQKNVRLCRPGPAVRVALALLKHPDRGADELLRRLPVICLEDALLHPALPLVAWLGMARPKGYALGGTAANALLKIVHQLAAVRVRDWLPPLASAAVGVGRAAAAEGGEEGGEDETAAAAAAGAAQPQPLSLATVDARLRLPPAEAALVKALLARAAYGGMGGDVAMLRGYAALWARRFASGAGGGAGDDEGCAGPPPPLEAVWWLGDGEALGGLAAAAAVAPAASSSPPDPQQQQKPPASAAAAAGPPAPPSPWLSFCQACYGAAARVPMDPPPPGGSSAAAAAATAAVAAVPPPLTLIGPLDVRRGDIPLSAVDHHVSDVAARLLLDEDHGAGHHQEQQAAAAGAAAGKRGPAAAAATPAAALRRLAASSWGAEADEATLAARALWLFRSCASRKLLLPLARAERMEVVVAAEEEQPGPPLPPLPPPPAPPPPPPPPLLLPALSSPAASRLRSHSWGEALAYEIDADAAQRERLGEFWRCAAPVADAFARAFLARRFF